MNFYLNFIYLYCQCIFFIKNLGKTILDIKNGSKNLKRNFFYCLGFIIWTNSFQRKFLNNLNFLLRAQLLSSLSDNFQIVVPEKLTL